MVLRDDDSGAVHQQNLHPHQLGLARRIVGPPLPASFREVDTVVIPQSLEPHIGLAPAVEAMIEPALERGSCCAA